MIALLLAWLLASPAEAASCSGPACDEIKLRTVGACVWVQSRSRDRVEVEARLAKGPVTLALEPADAKKAEESPGRKPAADGKTNARDQRQLRCQRAFAAECRRAAAQPKAAQEMAVHAYVFDPLFPNSKGTPVYRTRLVQGGACVAKVDDIQSYTARYPDRPTAVDRTAARPSLASFCSGDDRPIALKVRAIAIDIGRSLAPGKSTKLITFSSCVRSHEITSYETNYAT